MSREVRVALIGAGGIAAWHVGGYLAGVGPARLVAVVDVDLDRAAALAERGAGIRTAGDYQAVLKASDIDAVDICLPHHLHRDAIVAAAEAGKHILCEKPLCLSMAEAADVQSAVRASGVTLMCAHNELYTPAVARAREMIQAGELGAIYGARTTEIFRNEFTPESMGWRARRATAGGGVLIDSGYHPAYLLLHLVGTAPETVMATTARHRLTFMDGEDTADLIVTFARGAVGTIATSWAYDPPGSTEKFSVTGELGSLWSDGASLDVQLVGDVVSRVVTAGADSESTFAAEIEEFGQCVAEGRRPTHTEREGITVLQVILAAYESAESGRRVALVELEDAP